MSCAARHLVELLQDGLVEALTDAVGLRVIGFGPGMLDVVDRQVERVIMGLWLSAILGPAISQHTDQAHALPCEEGQYPIIEQIGYLPI
jgi:hypothetical protein